MHVLSSKDLNSLEKKLGYSFRNKSLLKEALTHKSFAHEKSVKPSSFNERLEFLGDAVLELIISEYLFCLYSEYTEADLSRIKAYTVQESSLSKAAKNLDIGDYLLLGKGEEMTGGRQKVSLLADAFEAIIASIYLDGGYENAKEFTLALLESDINEIVSTNLVFDFKTKLQEVSQAKFGVLPKYKIHKEEGPEHKKIFEVRVFINNKYFGSGTGRTKKAASQKAADAALKKIDHIDNQITN